MAIKLRNREKTKDVQLSNKETQIKYKMFSPRWLAVVRNQKDVYSVMEKMQDHGYTLHMECIPEYGSHFHFQV